METALLRLLNTLEEIGRADEGLYDTYVKEQTAERFIEVYFAGDVQPRGPVEYGMLSDTQDKAIDDAFATFAGQLAKSGDFAAASEEDKFRLLNGLTTRDGQFAENFFGALTPDSIRPDTAPKRPRHWLQAGPVYVLFVTAPAIVALSVGLLAFPGLLNGPIKLLVFVALAGLASMWVGDHGYQFLANRTYRKHRDQATHP